MMVKYGGNGYGASGQQNSCTNLDMEKNSGSRQTPCQEGQIETKSKSGDIGIVFLLGFLVGSCETRSQIRIWSKNVRGGGPRKDGQSLMTGGGD